MPLCRPHRRNDKEVMVQQRKICGDRLGIEPTTSCLLDGFTTITLTAAHKPPAAKSSVYASLDYHTQWATKPGVTACVGESSRLAA